MATDVENGRIEVTCSSGIDVMVVPLPLLLLEKFDLAHQEPIPPQMEVEIAGGAKETVDDLEDPDYVEELADYEKTAVDDLMNLVVLFGMEFDMPDDDGWKHKLSLVGVPIPDGEDEVSYAKCFIMRDTLSDLRKIVSTSLMLSGVDEEAIQSWVDLF